MAARISKRPITRRDLLKSSSLLALSGVVPARTISDEVFLSEEGSHNLDVGPSIYESIGVRPIINCKGTFTIISGSQSLPEVKKAMEEASRHYVQMDELMEAVGQRLAEITKAEWGIVTAGCSAAITNATAACIAGSNPERMQRLPNLQGLKNEIIMAKYSRNVYDHAARMLGTTARIGPAERHLDLSLYGGTGSFDQVRPRIGSDRSSEALAAEQHVPSEHVGAAATYAFELAKAFTDCRNQTSTSALVRTLVSIRWKRFPR